ncbi:MAG: hypothetical protein FWH43_07020 [Endomicrobia bacterium]|nr:hypothetical protein [Endomicrobiia bacterium]
MKNVSVIFFLVILFFILVFAGYIIAFKLYFSSDRLINKTKHLARMTFQRDVNVSGMSFSPFGTFNSRSFSMAARGSFEKGTLININKMSAKINLVKLFRRELHAGEFFIDGMNIMLNYENNKKFDYAAFFSNLQFIFMREGKRVGILKKIEIKNIDIQNANVFLRLDRGNVKFANIALMSRQFGIDDNFSGDISFDFEFKGRQYGAVLKFEYDNVSNEIKIPQLRCEELMLTADGNIGLLENGRISLDFNVSAAEPFFTGILEKITGNNYLENSITSSEIIENVKVRVMGTEELTQNKI